MWWKDGNWVMKEWVLVYLHAMWYRTGPIMICGVTEVENRLTGGFVTDRTPGANTLPWFKMASGRRRHLLLGVNSTQGFGELEHPIKVVWLHVTSMLSEAILLPCQALSLPLSQGFLSWFYPTRLSNLQHYLCVFLYGNCSLEGACT